MRSFLLCFLSFSLLGMMSAQTPVSSMASSSAQLNSQLRDLYFRSLADGSSEAKEVAAQKAEIAYQRRLFYDKANHFIKLWTKMTREFNQNTVDVKLARKVSDAFHDLEKSDGWPAQNLK